MKYLTSKGEYLKKLIRFWYFYILIFLLFRCIYGLSISAANILPDEYYYDFLFVISVICVISYNVFFPNIIK